MVRNGSSLLLVLLLLNGCSFKKETPINHEEYPDFSTEQKKHAVVESVIPIKNTSTFHTVLIKYMTFQPAELTLHKGDTVLWVNKDITDHDVTEETSKAWTSSKLVMGKSWSKVITKSDAYYCSIHLVMKGKLVVE
jgi:plastocyanin